MAKINKRAKKRAEKRQTATREERAKRRRRRRVKNNKRLITGIAMSLLSSIQTLKDDDIKTGNTPTKVIVPMQLFETAHKMSSNGKIVGLDLEGWDETREDHLKVLKELKFYNKDESIVVY